MVPLGIIPRVALWASKQASVRYERNSITLRIRPSHRSQRDKNLDAYAIHNGVRGEDQMQNRTRWAITKFLSCLNTRRIFHQGSDALTPRQTSADSASPGQQCGKGAAEKFRSILR